jgi:hypothetical protein
MMTYSICARPYSLLSRLLALAPLLLLPFCAVAENDNSNEVRLQIPALPELQRYEDLLSYPTYLAVVLDNNGLSPSLSHRPTLINPGTLRIGPAVLRFKEKTGSIYRYEAGVTINLGLTESEFTFPLVVDTEGIRTGKILVVLKPPLGGFLPSELLGRIQIKAELLSNVHAQQKIYAYLDKLSASGKRGDDVRTLFEPILLDAYNKSAASSQAHTSQAHTSQPIDAFSLSDQWGFLLAMLASLLVVSIATKARKNSPRAN